MTYFELLKALLAREWARILQCFGTCWTIADWKSCLLLWIYDIVHQISVLLLVLLLVKSANSLQFVSKITSVRLASFATSIPYLTAWVSTREIFPWNFMFSLLQLSLGLVSSPKPATCLSLWTTTSTLTFKQLIGGGLYSRSFLSSLFFFCNFVPSPSLFDKHPLLDF